MKRGIIVFILLIFFGILNAQKVVKKSVLNPDTSAIFIDAEDCFKVEVTTTHSKEIVVEALIDGEYKNELLLAIKEEDSSLLISPDFQPSYIKPGDKLSAHKVVSISLRVQLPENMKVSLFGTNTNVYFHGRYKDLQVTLDDGICYFQGIKGKAHALTRSGDIYVYSKGATIETKNSFGNTELGNIPGGKDYFNLVTTTGNIYLKKTE
ncbi:MAG: hypothetical protein HKP42_05395 [Maribacter sp.]|nr:hypothetical protein [Maribacter sp.]NND78327.1 hypothetical protein [Maribacter sp.]NNK75483.1 hypothetical protein [Maribacter sp.]